MGSRSVGSAPPPFYWKVPVPEKDYMSENYRRIRQIANQSQKKRGEPMKAAFIPGVTKNEKYSHVQSRVGEFLKGRKTVEESTVQNPRRQNQRVGSSPAGAGSQQINRRMSKSSTDLRSNNVNVNQAPAGLPSAVPTNSFNASTRRRRPSQESFNPASESVYNWRFKDDVVNDGSLGASFSNGLNNSSLSIPAKYCHRVEYLPCDGICAEENFVVDETHPDSARSGSSCRTSRGCNTEETRILEDPVKTFELNRHVDEETNVEATTARTEVNQRARLPKSRSVFTLPSQENISGRKNQSNDWFQSNNRAGERNDLDSRLSSMKVSTGTGTGTGAQTFDGGMVKTSFTSLRSDKPPYMNGNGGAGDLPHTLGTVPKYLKQRQEEWKTQEKEKREAEMNSNVPHGYVLLSDEERLEHLKTFKRNYDMLINDLNRIPIRIDTIRVKEQKINLEQQLTRLEEAMKTFSRPKVWVKVEG